MGRSDWKAAPREEKRNRFRAIVAAEPPPGILAYASEKAVGWCAVGPRATLPQMNSSRVAAPFDGIDGVWAVNCFYIRSGWRGRGLMPMLLGAAFDFAAAHGARIIEACPLDTQRKLMWGEGYVGIASVFRAAGFEEVARRSPTRPLMRKRVGRPARRQLLAWRLPPRL
jgi:GNAT superfamily N-acetyltransferase